MQAFKVVGRVLVRLGAGRSGTPAHLASGRRVEVGPKKSQARITIQAASLGDSALVSAVGDNVRPPQRQRLHGNAAGNSTEAVEGRFS